MVARRKRKKNKAKRISFRPGSLRKKKKQKTSWFGPRLINILKVLAVICVLAGIVVGFFFLERYVKETSVVSDKTVRLELTDVPAWVNSRLKEKVLAAAKGDGEDLRLDENAAALVEGNIKREIAWLDEDEVKVQTTYDRLRIEGRWRRPLALVKSGLHKFYVDDELVVLNFVEMPHLPIVKITGLPLITKTPPLGEVWQRDDLAAAVAILEILDRRDKIEASQKPLLSEIDSIDVSNFEGRKATRLPHIVLYAKDNTKIIWGAEVGMWHRHFEAKDEDKLAILYGFYKENGTLLNVVKYINLCDPQGKIPLPIDKY